MNFSAKGTGAASSGKAVSELGDMEVALDVGGICGRLGPAGPWVLDHHFVPEPCPSAVAVVLTNVRELRDHYRDGATCVVTHQEPDFDALLSAWLFAQITNPEGKLAREDFSSIDLEKTDWLDSRVSWGEMSAILPKRPFSLPSMLPASTRRALVQCGVRAIRLCIPCSLPRVIAEAMRRTASLGFSKRPGKPWSKREEIRFWILSSTEADR